MTAEALQRYVDSLFERKGLTQRQMQVYILETADELMACMQKAIDKYECAPESDLDEAAEKEFVRRLQAHGVKVDQPSHTKNGNCVTNEPSRSPPSGQVNTTPNRIICYRCKKANHIAKGCKEYRCFRCKEVGHIALGCRAHLPKRSRRQTQKSVGTGSCVSNTSSYPGTEPSSASSSYKPVPAPRRSLLSSSQQDCPPSVTSGASNPCASVNHHVSSLSSGGLLQHGQMQDCVETHEQEIDVIPVDVCASPCELMSISPSVEQSPVCAYERSSEKNAGNGDDQLRMSEASSPSEATPVWSLMSDELGVDVSTLSLPQFLDLVEGNHDIDLDLLQTVMGHIRKDIEKCKANGSVGKESFL